MELTDISFWGIACIVLLMSSVLFICSVIDRRLFMRVLRVLSYFLLGMLTVTFYMWVLWRVDSWWANTLWIIASSISVSTLLLRRTHLRKRRFFLPVPLSVSGGVGVVTLITHLLLPQHAVLLIPALTGVMAAWMLNAVSLGLNTFLGSLCYTQEHYRYLLANGASHFEAILPSIRRSLRAVFSPFLRSMTSPVILTPPMLLCGLLMAGVTPVMAVLFTFLLAITILSASVLTVVTMFILLDHFLFDRSGRFLL